jgi:hypothetical protein
MDVDVFTGGKIPLYGYPKEFKNEERVLILASF